MTAPRTQLDALTGARGLAAWFVVLYHIRLAASAALPAPFMSVLAKGYLAVDLFFVLSGFVMWLTYAATFREKGLAAAPDFLWRRLARIYPLHIAVLGATLAYALALTLAGKANAAQYPFAELPLHVILIQNWGFTPRLSWNDPSWSISTEMAAYLLLPLAAVTLFRRDWPPLLCAGGALGLAAILDAWLTARGAPTLGVDIVTNGLPRCLAGFFSGVLMAMAWQQLRTRAQATMIAAVILLAAATGYASGLLREGLAFPIGFTALVYLLAETSARPGNPLTSRLAVHLGDISYSTYLAHFLLWIVFKHLFVSDPANVALPLLGAFLLLVYIASRLLHALIEAPGRAWLQSRAPKRARKSLA